MKLFSSIFFAKSLIFPKTEKKSSARKSIIGAMVCIGLSIIPLILVISISNGMINGMTQRIIGLSSGHLKSYVASSIKQVKTEESFVEYAKGTMEVEGITANYPEIQISALASGKNIRCGIEIRAMQPDIFEKNSSFKTLFEIKAGSLQEFQENQKVCIIGEKLASDLDLQIGDSIKIITTKNSKNKTKTSITPKLTTLKIAAIVTSGYQELDQFWVFVPLSVAYKNLSLENAQFNVIMETENPFASEIVRTQYEVARYFGRYANVYRWDQIHAAEFENFSSTKVMLIFVMIMIILVASVNISSAIIMLVMERQKEIAILKSLGATPNGIILSFLISGVSCGIGGILIGVPLGLIFSFFSNQIISFIDNSVNFVLQIFHGSSFHLMDPAFYLQNIPIQIPVFQIVMIIIGILLLSVIVSYFPARKAGKEKPLDILRKV